MIEAWMYGPAAFSVTLTLLVWWWVGATYQAYRRLREQMDSTIFVLNAEIAKLREENFTLRQKEGLKQMDRQSIETMRETVKQAETLIAKIDAANKFRDHWKMLASTGDHFERLVEGLYTEYVGGVAECGIDSAELILIKDDMKSSDFHTEFLAAIENMIESLEDELEDLE